MNGGRTIDLDSLLAVYNSTQDIGAFATAAVESIRVLEAEVARLRLTDAEREAVTEASGLYVGTRTGLALCMLLERQGGAT